MNDKIKIAIALLREHQQLTARTNAFLQGEKSYLSGDTGLKLYISEALAAEPIETALEKTVKALEG